MTNQIGTYVEDIRVATLGVAEQDRFMLNKVLSHFGLAEPMPDDKVEFIHHALKQRAPLMVYLDLGLSVTVDLDKTSTTIFVNVTTAPDGATRGTREGPYQEVSHTLPQNLGEHGTDAWRALYADAVLSDKLLTVPVLRTHLLPDQPVVWLPSNHILGIGNHDAT